MEATDKNLANHKKVETVRIVDEQSQEEQKDHLVKVVYVAEEVVTVVIIVIEATVERELKTCWMIVISREMKKNQVTMDRCVMEAIFQVDRFE